MGRTLVATVLARAQHHTLSSDAAGWLADTNVMTGFGENGSGRRSPPGADDPVAKAPANP